MVLISKKLFISLFLILLCGCYSSPDINKPAGDETSINGLLPNDTLRIFCTEDQHSLTCQWMKDFQKNYSGIHTEVLLYNRNIPLEQSSFGKHDLALVLDSHSKLIPEGCWRIKYARDGIVCIINKANLCCKEILESGLGIQQVTFKRTDEKSGDWTKPSGYEQNSLIKVFICSDTLSACKLLADYLKMDADEFRIIKTASVQDLIDSVRMHHLSVGICCQRYAYDPLTRREIPEVKIVPLDCNGNGIMENKEKFYDHFEELQRAMWTGKYPCHSFLNHHIVAIKEPSNQLPIDFMKWILTEGQKQLQNEGYVLLRTRSIKEEINKLNEILH
jgi:phosphate transport system substrate-binding protein